MLLEIKKQFHKYCKTQENLAYMHLLWVIRFMLDCIKSILQNYDTSFVFELLVF